MVDHSVVHFEIVADDVEKLMTVYKELFVWKIEKSSVDGLLDDSDGAR